MIDVSGLYCGYGNKDVLYNVCFNVQENEKLCVIGPNGCGKTTLMRALIGFIPSRGEIKLCGKKISDMKRKELSSKIALLSQISVTSFDFSVYETVALGRYTANKKGLFHEDSKVEKEKIIHYIESVGLLDIKDKPITELSGGQLQRVMLARTLAQEPSIILLDEPTNHLDLKYQLDLIDYLKNWAGKPNHCLIGVMHDLNLAMQLADKILLMGEGKVEAFDNAKNVLNSEKLSTVFKTDIKKFMQNSLNMWNQ